MAEDSTSGRSVAYKIHAQMSGLEAHVFCQKLWGSQRRSRTTESWQVGVVRIMEEPRGLFRHQLDSELVVRHPAVLRPLDNVAGKSPAARPVLKFLDPEPLGYIYWCVNMGAKGLPYPLAVEH